MHGSLKTPRQNQFKRDFIANIHFHIQSMKLLKG